MGEADGNAPHIFSMGPQTLCVDRAKLHSATRRKVVEGMKNALPEAERGIVVLQGGGPNEVYSTDMDDVFRQEAYFHYLFGVETEDWYGAVDLRTGRATLFMPRLPASYAVWMGEIRSPAYFKARYAVDAVHYVDELAGVLAAAAPPALHVLHGINTDSNRAVPGAKFEGMERFKVERDTLFNVITEARVFPMSSARGRKRAGLRGQIKTEEELEVLRYANAVASSAHVEVMRKCRPGLMEYSLEAAFLHDCYLLGGCRHAPYTPICASGPNGAVLHCGHAGMPNDRQLADGDMMLLDIGCEYYRYGSDITASFPANGRFSPDQRAIYEAVLAAFNAVLDAMRPGVAWPDMHILAERHLLGGLRAAGFVKGDVEEMLDKRLGALFMPHGLGHFLGLDTHDVGGYAAGCPARIDQPGLRSLRTARTLEENMVITVEPGCYFGAYLLRPALGNPTTAPFLVHERLEPLIGVFGGVRLEDNVLVTASGAESFTSLPRMIGDIEAVMAGGPWPAD